MLPKKIFFHSDGCTANLEEEIIDKKTKEISGRYRYEDGYFFRDKEVVLTKIVIDKLKGNNLVTIN